jgi:hypothetical protein
MKHDYTPGTMTCACCRAKYTRREWRCCSAPNGIPSRVWQERWHGHQPNLDPGECGKCPHHCTCDRPPAGSPEMIAWAERMQKTLDAMREASK